MKDETTDWLVRELARRRGIGITEAIKTAVQESLMRETEDLASAQGRIEPILARVREAKRLTFAQTEEAMNEMWDDT